MATRKDDRAPRTPRRGGRGRSALPAKNLINKNPRTQKLTIAERDYMLECFAKGWPPAKVREAMRQRGILNTPTLVSVAGAARTNAEEIAQRKARWYAQLRGEPLAQPRDRLRERIKMYNLCILGQFREACPGCGGEGKVPALVPPVGADGKPLVAAKGQPGPPLASVNRRCDICKGRKWLLPPEALALEIVLERDVRLDTLPALPPGGSGEWLDRARDLLGEIREEVGDHWSPRDRGQTGGESSGQHLHLHAADAEVLRGMLEMVRALPAERRVALYGGGRGDPIAVVQPKESGDGKGDGRG